jgi:hypothetical protein
LQLHTHTGSPPAAAAHCKAHPGMLKVCPENETDRGD